MDQQTKETQLFRGFMIGIGAALAIVTVTYLVQQQRTATKQEELLKELQKQIQEVPKEPEEKLAFPDYYVATKDSSIKRVVITGNLKSFVKKETAEIVGSTTVTLQRQGKIARGYLVVRASVDGGRPLTIYDSVFIKLNDAGGHLLRNRSLEVPVGSGTTLLYALNSIPYLPNIPYDENRQASTTNWLTKLNQSTRPFVMAFVSTARDGGLLKEVSFSYECDKETPDCSISLQP